MQERTRDAETADLTAWLAVAAGTLGAFMALLDVSIVNAALPMIQGEIGATKSEGTWVGTSYLVAEIVIMPLTAWLEKLLGLRRVLLVGATIFTIFSVVCGFATDLTTMILGRIGQGLAGGTLIPTGMTIMAKRLPPRQQSIGMAIFASAALLGPVFGPLLGGWLTEHYSWHYAFFINVPICAGLVLLILAGLQPETGDWNELINADWIGIAGMMLALGSLTVLLEEGHREQWFDSMLIWKLAASSVVGVTLVAIGQLWSRTPVLKLALLRDRGLASAVAMTMVTGGILFGTMFIIPQFLVAVADYNAFQAGSVVFVLGVTSILAAVAYPLLVARLHIRVIIGVAMLSLALASFSFIHLTAESVGAAFAFGLALKGFGFSLLAIPLQQAVISAVAVEDAAQATSLFNISRNLGASIGLAALAGFFDRRLEFHHWRLLETLGANDLAVQERIGGISAALGGGREGMAAAYRAIDAQVMTQSLVMTFNDIFLAFTLVAIATVPLVFFLRPIDTERAQGMLH